MFSARRGLAVLCLLASCNASGEILPNVSLEAFTSPELARAIAGGKTTVLVPIGGTEQNGPYMVLGKHNVRAKALAERIAIQLGNALVAPVMAYVPEGGTNPPTAHMRFPGTITITEAAFESILESTVLPRVGERLRERSQSPRLWCGGNRHPRRSRRHVACAGGRS